MKIVYAVLLFTGVQVNSAFASEQNSSFIQKEFYKLGVGKKYPELKQLITIATLDEIKELLLTELNLALSITERVFFDFTDSQDSTSFYYAEQALIPSPLDRVRAQWAYLLLEAKKELEATQKFNIDTLEYALSLIAFFLDDMGTLLNDYKPTQNLIQAKQKLFDYAQKLFPIYQLVAHKPPYKDVMQMKQILDMQPNPTKRPVRLKPIARPATAKPKAQPVRLVPVTKPAAAGNR